MQRTAKNQRSDNERGVKKIETALGQPTYLHCNSADVYKAVPTDSNSNKALNLHLGMPFNPREFLLLRRCLKILSDFFSLFEDTLCHGWNSVPLQIRQKITVIAWAIYFPLHRLLLSNRTAIHKDASYEYHAMTTVMYWGRMFPITIRRIRFSLSQLSVWHSPNSYPASLPYSKREEYKRNQCSQPVPIQESNMINVKGGYIPTNQDIIHGVAAHVFSIKHDMSGKTKLTGQEENPTNTTVTGYYVQHRSEESRSVILWLYGGAFLGGDSKNNVSFAEKVGQRCGYTDVFLPDYRLIPEHRFVDALHDVIQAYEYLVTVRKVSPDNILLYGISSGGGLITRLLQTISEKKEELDSVSLTLQSNEDFDPILLSMPIGAVLMCPFVDYSEPKGSFVEYKIHDLIVNESVYEVGTPYLAKEGDDEYRRQISPVYRSFKGLPPLCIVVSEHECVYDQDIMLCNNARMAGVEVDLGVWKYMCHVWPVLSGFVPEGKQAVDFMCDWMNSKLEHKEMVH